MNIFLLALGYLCVGLGVLGIVLPLLPTTPFLLLASFLFYKSSPKAQAWLLNHKYLGNYIRTFQEERALPLRVKITSVAMLWATILFSVFCVVEKEWVSILLLAIAVGVTIHILSYKTKKVDHENNHQ